MDDARLALVRRLLPDLPELAGAPRLEVPWLVVNHLRVDAGITSEDGREWRVVFTTVDGETATDVVIFERPPHFAGVPGGRAVVVNGPSGSGKSSLMLALQTIAPDPWVVFDEVIVGSAPMPYHIWPETAGPLHAGARAAIATLAAAGNQVAVTGGGYSQAEWRDVLGAVPTLYVGLDCPLPVLLRRERGRGGRWGGLAESSLGVHDGWTYDFRFDSTTAEPPALAAQVLAAWSNAPGRSSGGSTSPS